MKETKFKIWDSINSKMIYPKKGKRWVNFRINMMGEITENGVIFKGGTLLQYTGLNDKNGKEIHAGDIVNIENTKIAHVVYVDNAMKFYYQVVIGDGAEFTATSDKIEVIGNIYQNPAYLSNSSLS